MTTTTRLTARGWTLEMTIEEEEEDDDDDRGNDRPRLSWAGPVIATGNEVQDRDSSDVVESR